MCGLAGAQTHRLAIRLAAASAGPLPDGRDLSSISRLVLVELRAAMTQSSAPDEYAERHQEDGQMLHAGNHKVSGHGEGPQPKVG